MLIRVVLPEPDGPMKETNSPLVDGQRDVVDGDDLLGAAACRPCAGARLRGPGFRRLMVNLLRCGSIRGAGRGRPSRPGRCRSDRPMTRTMPRVIKPRRPLTMTRLPVGV